MQIDDNLIVFGAAVGRCGTMTLANLLNNEDNFLCLHEGSFRHSEEEGDRLLPALVLQNVLAYHQPERAKEIFQEARAGISGLMEEHGVTGLGDIAYYNSPFVGVIPEIYPRAKLVVVLRDGRDFLRSAYTDLKPDPMPAGWPESDKTLTKLERFISLGRLRPRNDSELAQEWANLPAFERNAWLWNTTYRLIMDGVKQWPDEQVKIIRFEEFFNAPLEHYADLRQFLGLPGEVPSSAEGIIHRPINVRPHYKLAKWPEWDADLNRRFSNSQAK